MKTLVSNVRMASYHSFLLYYIEVIKKKIIKLVVIEKRSKHIELEPKCSEIHQRNIFFRLKHSDMVSQKRT